MERRAVLWGSKPWVDSAAKSLEAIPLLSINPVDPERDDLVEVGNDGLDFLFVAHSPIEQSDLVIQGLAADVHVLAVEHLAATAEESQRCVTIALNRGLRLAVLKLSEPLEPQIEQFAAWIEGGVEPERSGRRWLAEHFGAPS